MSKTNNKETKTKEHFYKIVEGVKILSEKENMRIFKVF